jgi:L-threonylcarbamoyladenylate synthase
MKIIRKSNKVVGLAVEVLKAGGLVIFPTETVYGVGADATNRQAIEKLNSYKKRPLGKPYSIAVANQKMAEEYAVLNEAAKNLYKEFLPGPVTVVSQGKHKVASGVESEIGTIGIRIPAYPLVLEIIQKLGVPITATSANASYQKRPHTVSDILDNISQKQKGLIDLIIDVGQLPKNEPSTVIDTTLDEPAVLRQGDIKLKSKNRILSRSEENTQNVGKELWQKYENYLGKRPIIFALEGEMGAGKTVFTKGLARAMGIKEEIVSPTFSLILNYKGGKNQELTHVDAWRIQNSKELENLGFVEMLEDKNAVLAIEWADRVIDTVKSHRQDAVIVWVKIIYGKGENERLISWGAL